MQGQQAVIAALTFRAAAGQAAVDISILPNKSLNGEAVCRQPRGGLGSAAGNGTRQPPGWPAADIDIGASKGLSRVGRPSSSWGRRPAGTPPLPACSSEAACGWSRWRPADHHTCLPPPPTCLVEHSWPPSCSRLPRRPAHATPQRRPCSHARLLQLPWRDRGCGRGGRGPSWGELSSTARPWWVLQRDGRDQGRALVSLQAGRVVQGVDRVARPVWLGNEPSSRRRVATYGHQGFAGALSQGPPSPAPTAPRVAPLRSLPAGPSPRHHNHSARPGGDREAALLGRRLGAVAGRCHKADARAVGAAWRARLHIPLHLEVMPCRLSGAAIVCCCSCLHGRPGRRSHRCHFCSTLPPPGSREPFPPITLPRLAGTALHPHPSPNCPTPKPSPWPPSLSPATPSYDASASAMPCCPFVSIPAVTVASLRRPLPP